MGFLQHSFIPRCDTSMNPSQRGPKKEEAERERERKIGREQSMYERAHEGSASESEECADEPWGDGSPPWLRAIWRGNPFRSGDLTHHLSV